jgi:hypothetical protein
MKSSSANENVASGFPSHFPTTMNTAVNSILKEPNTSHTHLMYCKGWSKYHHHSRHDQEQGANHQWHSGHSLKWSNTGSFFVSVQCMCQAFHQASSECKISTTRFSCM